MNDCRKTHSQSEREAFEVSNPPTSEKTDSDYWFEVLESDAEQNSKLAGQAGRAFPRLRPLFLRLFRWVFRLWSGLHVVGVENLPIDRPYILAVNHECHLDNLFVACLLPKDIQQKMVVLSKKEHFAHLLTRLVAKLCHGVPVDRAQISAGALGICFQVLKQGGVLLIHPEGTRSPDGRLQPFRKGVAILARYAACPIVPVHIEGGHEFWPKHSFFPRRRQRISVSIGSAIAPQTIAAQTTKDLTQQLMASVAALEKERAK